MTHQLTCARSRLASFAALSTIVLLAGCGMRPKPMPLADHIKRADADHATIVARYLPLDGDLTLGTAIARALKFNYDSQVAKLEINQQEKQLDLALMQMLPHLAADAGYTDRSNNNAAESIDEFTNQRSLDYSYSEMPSHGSGDISFSWNAMDAGISYFSARQQAFRALIAVERRRRAINDLVKAVTTNYWEAAAAQVMLPRLDPIIHDAEVMLAASQDAGNAHLQSPLTLLDYQQNIIQILGEMRRIKDELVGAQIQLASLINVPQDEKLNLATHPQDVQPLGNLDIPTLERMGLVMRPELRMEVYQQKVDRQDVYKEILKMMPGIGAIGNGNFDSNALLYHHIWGQIGVRATVNLINMIQGPRAIAVAKGNVKLSEMRRLALSVAILAQINLSAQKYVTAVDFLKSSRQINDVSLQMEQLAVSASAAGAQSEANRVRHQMAALLGQLEYSRSLAHTHQALANLYASIGVDLVPANADIQDLKHLTAQVEHSIALWENGRLPDLTLPDNVKKPDAGSSTTPVAVPVQQAAPPSTPVAQTGTAHPGPGPG
ncbi:transporter [Komagataeibacter nataicola]|uniref:Transporter n=2 Tax=Komagataeibacter nataicola TaxID=265960 RepID=A0A9N7H2I8_9PROT|nr:TolC family protein [Komagataeibacter nataicola]AQU89172.1 transporter [Komagataeibacter nataicola]PYD66670.1 transporter [Komagataeibacter nataicola]WNM08623.1 TolC family protein [Komagataeibacter nataicola]GBR26072.1 outer membrane efflux protein [Komagataeibacter nataicola NRIC 0616]